MIDILHGAYIGFRYIIIGLFILGLAWIVFYLAMQAFVWLVEAVERARFSWDGEVLTLERNVQYSSIRPVATVQGKLAYSDPMWHMVWENKILNRVFLEIEPLVQYSSLIKAEKYCVLYKLPLLHKTVRLVKMRTAEEVLEDGVEDFSEFESLDDGMISMDELEVKLRQDAVEFSEKMRERAARDLAKVFG